MIIRTIEEIQNKFNVLLKKISKGKSFHHKGNLADKHFLEFKDYIGFVWEYEHDTRQQVMDMIENFFHQAYVEIPTVKH